MSDGMRAAAEQLRARSTMLQGLDWPELSCPNIVAPSELPCASDAADNIAQNASGLRTYQQVGQNEGTRLAESLTAVANAYEEVDSKSKEAIESGTGASPGSVVPAPPSTAPMPAPPAIPSAKPVDAGGYSNVKETEAQLSAGDQGASLRAAAEFWRQQASQLQLHAESFNTKGIDWEGSAAEAADAKFGEYAAWVNDLAYTWIMLADEATKVAEAHRMARFAHTPLYEAYVELEEILLWMMTNGGTVDGMSQQQVIQKMKELQDASDEIRKQYAESATTTTAAPGQIPEGVVPPIGVGSDTAPGGPGGPASPSTGTGGSGGGAPSGGAPSTPQTPTSATTPAAQQAAQSGGTPSGGGAPSGGGSPSGGGAPSGGGMPGGLPGGLPGGKPDGLPKEPSLKPAASGGGAGGGSGAGGGGGGVPGSPLQPAVSAEGVAPSPTGAGRGGVAPAVATGGAMGGGMGMGGMPVGHGAGQNQGKEKKRDPKLAPDEDLYTEDRPWTEAVIGQRRRKEAPENKESK